MADTPNAEKLVEGAMAGEVLHLDGGAIDKLAELGREAAGIYVDSIRLDGAIRGLPGEVPIGVRSGEHPEIVSVKQKLEEFRLFPERKAGTAKALTLQSFVDLVNRHKTENTAIFANSDWRKPSVVAVIDYHAVAPDGDPAWLKHRVSYEFPLSQPWQEWVGQNGEKMDQVDFATYLEDHIADLSSPEDAERADYERTFGTKMATPAELIQLSRGLQVFSGVQVKNAVTLQSGEASIVFEEEHRDAAGNRLQVPGLFILSIAPFFMGDLVRIPVRLRYRLVTGRLTWFFQIYRPDLAVTDRVRADLDIIRRDTALPVFEGAPEI